MLMKKDLRAIGKYVSDGFGSLGILASAPTILEDVEDEVEERRGLAG